MARGEDSYAHIILESYAYHILFWLFSVPCKITVGAKRVPCHLIMATLPKDMVYGLSSDVEA